MMHPSADSPPAARPPHDRRFFVSAMIAAASVLFLIAAAVLYFRWASTNEPICVIVVQAAPSLKGAEISVDNIMFAKPLKVTIGENDRYAIPFYVEPGEYEVKVTLAGEVQHQSQVTVSRSARGRLLDLKTIRPTTSPTTADGAT